MMVKGTGELGGWVTKNPKLCTHKNAYTNEMVGTSMCPDCGCMRFPVVQNVKTGEKRMGWNAVLSGAESNSGEWNWGEVWEPSPTRVKTQLEFARHMRDLDRAFAPDDTDYGEY